MSDYTDNPIARASINVIKKSRKHPSKGDVFIINPIGRFNSYMVVVVKLKHK